MSEADIIVISDDSDIEPPHAAHTLYESDEDIFFSKDRRRSSPVLPPSSSLPPSSQEQVYDISDLSDDEIPDPFRSDLFRDLSKQPTQRYQSSSLPSSPESLKRKPSQSEDKVDGPDLSKPKVKRRRKTAEEKALEQAVKELEKAKKKEETLRKKAELAAQKAEEKVAHKASKAANKLVIDKKATLKDMIVEVSPRLVNAPLFHPLRLKMAEYHCQVHPISSSSGGTVELIDVNKLRNLNINIIRWKRHVKATYDESQRKWIPLPEDKHHLRPEGTYLIYVTGDDLVNSLGKNPTIPSLEVQVSTLRQILGPKYHIHLMICGWKGKTNVTKILDYVQEQLVTLQVKESLFIEEVVSITDAVTWIYNISADLGIKPYKLIERSHLPFCPNSGNIKTGRGNSDTFEKMLAQLPRLSERSSRVVVKQFGSINRLMEEYKKAESRGGGPTMLINVPVPGSDRILNKALSERLYHLLWGSDPKVLVN